MEEEKKQSQLEEGAEKADKAPETASAAEEGAKEAKAVQSAEENSKYAEMRRRNEELEKRNRELEGRVRSGVGEDTLKALGLTREDLAGDESAMELTLAYSDAVIRGSKDPKGEAYEYVYRKRQAEEKASKSQNEAAEKDVKAFREKYPDTDLRKVVSKDSEFMSLFGDAPNLNGNVTYYYGLYRRMKQGGPKVPEKAKAESNPPTAGKATGESGKRYTADDIMKMSKAEYEEYSRKFRIH